jgi:hypothetical protein
LVPKQFGQVEVISQSAQDPKQLSSSEVDLVIICAGLQTSPIKPDIDLCELQLETTAGRNRAALLRRPPYEGEEIIIEASDGTQSCIKFNSASEFIETTGNGISNELTNRNSIFTFKDGIYTLRSKYTLSEVVEMLNSNARILKYFPLDEQRITVNNEDIPVALVCRGNRPSSGIWYIGPGTTIPLEGSYKTAANASKIPQNTIARWRYVGPLDALAEQLYVLGSQNPEFNSSRELSFGKKQQVITEYKPGDAKKIQGIPFKPQIDRNLRIEDIPDLGRLLADEYFGRVTSIAADVSEIKFTISISNNKLDISCQPAVPKSGQYRDLINNYFADAGVQHAFLRTLNINEEESFNNNFKLVLTIPVKSSSNDVRTLNTAATTLTKVFEVTPTRPSTKN